MKISILLAPLLLFILSVSFVFKNKTAEIKFIIPEGWPKPVYDFSGNPVSEAGFNLGRKLFFDPVLSRDSSISCASCHLQFSGFTHPDHALSHGINGLKGTRNASALFNLAWSRSFMWDGGVNNLEVQPLNPITNPVEMDNSLDNIIKHLNYSTTYKNLFFTVFGDSTITGQHILKALAQFTVMLESYHSKYDQYMNKEKDISFSESELHGLKLFRDLCSACHKEPLFTIQSFESNGLQVDPELNDFGRMKITGLPEDSLRFKVPSLRNVEFSSPYMHDGRLNTLEQVMDHYSSGIVQSNTLSKELKKPFVLSEEDKKDLIAFLKTLTDKDFLYDLRFRNYEE